MYNGYFYNQSYLQDTKYLDKKQISSFEYCTGEAYKLILSTIYIQSNTANQRFKLKMFHSS